MTADVIDAARGLAAYGPSALPFGTNTDSAACVLAKDENIGLDLLLVYEASFSGT